MSALIKAKLNNTEHPEYGCITVSFPVPSKEYDILIKTMKLRGIGDAQKQDCRVDKVDSRYAVLDQLEGTVVNLDELDYLAKRLDSFCENEDAQFQGMAYKLGLTDIKDLINLTFCCQQATVITNFSDLERIGRDHQMTLYGGSMLVEESRAVNGRKEALTLIQSGQGIVTPYGVVYDNGMELEQIYNGRQFPGYLYEDNLMVLEIKPKQGLEENQNPHDLYGERIAA